MSFKPDFSSISYLQNGFGNYPFIRVVINGIGTPYPR